MKATLYKTDGTQLEISPKDGTSFDLKEMQDYVGGYIEIHTIPGNQMMVMNEEAILLKLPVNPKATDLGRTLLHADGIRGNVIVGDPELFG